jgi:hypothetical protein
MGVDRITLGQLNNTGLAPNDDPGALIADTVNGVFDVVTATQFRQTMHTTLATLENQLPLSAVTTAQVLAAFALNPGLLNRPNRRLRLELEAVYSTTIANVAALTLVLTLGGTNLNTITITTNPAAGTTMYFNAGPGSGGTLVTFIANGATPIGNQVALGASATATATALYTFLAASTDVNIAKATYTNPSAGVVLMTSASKAFVPTFTASVPQDFTIQLSTTGGQTLATVVSGASNTAASTGLQIQAEFDVIVPAGNNFGGASAVVAKANVNFNLGTAASGVMSEYGDVNVAPASITIGTNPASGVTMNINGTLVTFIPNGNTPVGNQVALGTTTTLTATALYTFLAASTDPNIAKAVWTNPSNGVVVGTTAIAGFVPFASSSVPADFTFSTPTLDLTQQQTLVVTIAGSAAVPSAQLQNAHLKLIG